MTSLEEASLKLYNKVKKKIPINQFDIVVCNIQDEVNDLIEALNQDNEPSSELSRAAEAVRQATNSIYEYTHNLQELATRARTCKKSLSHEIKDIPVPNSMDNSIEYLCKVVERQIVNEGETGLIS
jgi:FtsZ-binding cell division protein ZapB